MGHSSGAADVRHAAEQDADDLRRECERLGRYLTGRRPEPQLCERYARDVMRHARRFEPDSELDRTLSALASLPLVPLRALDIGARFLCPSASIRRRLVFAAALLESTPSGAEAYERPTVRSAGGLALALAPRLLASGAALLLGVVLVGAAWAGGRAVRLVRSPVRSR